MTDHVSSYFVPRSSSRPRHRAAFAQDIASLKAQGYGGRAMYVRECSAQATSGPIETDITVPPRLASSRGGHAPFTRRSSRIACGRSPVIASHMPACDVTW
jgi:hypothetical protein